MVGGSPEGDTGAAPDAGRGRPEPGHARPGAGRARGPVARRRRHRPGLRDARALPDPARTAPGVADRHDVVEQPGGDRPRRRDRPGAQALVAGRLRVATRAARARSSATSRTPAHGGRQVTVNFTTRHWLGAHARILSGNNAHAYSDVNDNDHASSSEEVHPRQGPVVELPADAVQARLREVLLQQPVALLVEPRPAVLVAHQPGPERHAGLLLRQHLARPPEGGADRLHRGRRQLPAGQPQQARQGAVTPSPPRPTTARTPPTACPTVPTSTTPTWRRRPTATTPSMQMYLQHQPHTSYSFSGDAVLPDQRRRRGGHRLPRVHPRPVQPPGRRRPGPLDARWRAGRRDGRGLERLVRDGLPGAQGPRARPGRPHRPRDLPLRRQGGPLGPHRADGLQGRPARRRSATAARPPTAAATPTPTTAT